MAISVREKNNKPPKKTVSKVCLNCERKKKLHEYYKVDSILFPDGMVNVCSECIRAQLDYENKDEVIDLLRQMDKPFVESIWNLAVEDYNKTLETHPMTQYMRKINSMNKYKDMKHKDTGVQDEETEMDYVKEVFTDYGKKIVYSDDLAVKWGTHYIPPEVLQLEKLYQEMLVQYEDVTGLQKTQIAEVCVLVLKMRKAMSENDFKGYKALVDSQEKIMKGAKLLPSQMKDTQEEVGLKSFSEVFQRVEEKGFVPQLTDFPKDDIDDMLLLFTQGSQRFNEVHVSEHLENPNWRDTARHIRATIGDYRDITRPKEQQEFVMNSVKDLSDMKSTIEDGVEDNGNRDK